ncbi:hypothetical protein [Syntrophorhabdus aromaticivorans]|uniref:hypothetical protein n=1 Tax=Syntrophorhabdus aromaticivorans TaxID=328301 RepID=UPI0003FF3828|nr:hypothetical protein [Syntrophorhabdus aromaticivorans]
MGIILEARKTWRINEHTPTLDSCSEDSNYPLALLESARTVFRAHVSLMQNALIMFPHEDWYQKPTGENVLKHTLDSAWERVLKVARSSLAYGVIDKAVTDEQIIAIVAIGEAWRSLRDMLFYEEPEDDPAIARRILVAEQLLKRVLQAERDSFENFIKKTEPDRRAGRKVHQGQKLAGQGRAEQLQEDRAPIWAKWQEFANELWRRNPRLSILEVARRCSKTFQSTEYRGSPRTVRRIISK